MIILLLWTLAVLCIAIMYRISSAYKEYAVYAFFICILFTFLLISYE